MLDPQAVAALELWAQGPSVADPGFGPDDIALKRAGALAAAALEHREPMGRVEDLDANGVPCRLYVPSPVEPDPPVELVEPPGVLVFLHGGGFVFGDVETHDGQARRLANRTGQAVLAVDYRRPPEHRFPAAPDDVDRAMDWLLGAAPGLGLDPRRVVALGDSAGGNLALVAALRNPGVFAACVLIYPFLDPGTDQQSYDASDGGLTRAEAQWFWRHYARDEADLQSSDLAPLRSEALGTLPPTLVVVAQHDVLADEDLLLARRIQEAGVEVRCTTYPGMVHGFWRNPELFDSAEQSLVEIAAFLAETV
ncbi:MAG: alpha/beta hydrolase [Nocardioidaceae bacterium]